MGDKTTFDECVAKKMRDCDPKKLWQQVKYNVTDLREYAAIYLNICVTLFLMF